jgi:hypothetical protein
MKTVTLTVACLTAAALGLAASPSHGKAAPCAQGASGGKSIGAGNVLHGRAYINYSERYGDGNQLFSGNIVCTNNKGLFKFNVTAHSKGISCKVKSQSSLQLGPHDIWLVSYRSGTSRCRINGNKMGWLRAGNAFIRTKDPTFSVTVTHSQTAITVRQGRLRVFGARGLRPLLGRGNSVVVGPNQQTIVRAGKLPSRPTPVPQQSAQEQRDYSQLGAPLPNGSVTTDAIQNGAVTTAKLDDQAVTLGKLAPSARTPGPTGPPGPPGPQGAAGPSEAFSGFHDASVNVPNGLATIATLPIPTAGNYVIVGKVQLFNLQNTAVDVRCLLVAGADSDVSRTVLTGNSGAVVNDASVAFNLVHDFTAPGTVQLQCDAFGVNVIAQYIKITAIHVGKLTNTAI